MSIVLATLKSYLDADHELTLHCGDCQHHSTLDLRRLIETFGPDYDVVDNRAEFLSRFKCDRCGSKNLSLTVAYARAGKVSEMAKGVPGRTYSGHPGKGRP